MRLRVYVAGPYSAPTVQGRQINTNRAMDAGLAVMNKGHYPFVPHLTHYMDERQWVQTGSYRGWADWMALDEVFLDQCDALLFLGSSKGADIELARAEELGLQIFRSIDEIPVYAG